MSRWFGVDFICPQCAYKWDDLVEREKKSEEHDVTCPSCETDVRIKPAFGSPMVGRASLPDGTRAKNDSAYQRIRDAVKLERKAYNLPPDSKERKELFKTANNIKAGKLE